MNKDYIERAKNHDDKKDQEGLTLKNYNKFAVYEIKSMYPNRNGTFRENLKEAVTEHSGMFNKGIRLIAITYGIRRIIPDDTWIMTVSYSIMCSPFILLIFVMIWEHKTGQYDYSKKDDKGKSNKKIANVSGSKVYSKVTDTKKN